MRPSISLFLSLGNTHRQHRRNAAHTKGRPYSSNAFWLSFTSSNSTKANPRLWPVLRSFPIVTWRTGPYCPKRSFRRSSFRLYGTFPTKRQRDGSAFPRRRSRRSGGPPPPPPRGGDRRPRGGDRDRDRDPDRERDLDRDRPYANTRNVTTAVAISNSDLGQNTSPCSSFEESRVFFFDRSRPSWAGPGPNT